MNSPPEPASPSPSTPSSGSPPPDEVPYIQQPSNAGSHVLQLTSHLSSATFAQSSSKRRLPGGSAFAAASNTRDTKSRRREDSRRAGGGWGEGKEGGKRDKDDLVDIPIAEHLRKVIGDPFQEAKLKNAS